MISEIGRFIFSSKQMFMVPLKLLLIILPNTKGKDDRKSTRSQPEVNKKNLRRDDDEPEMDVKQFDVGQITVADVEEAISNKLSIINFNQPISKEIQNLVNENGVRVYHHNVIYKLFDEVETGKIFIKYFIFDSP